MNGTLVHHDLITLIALKKGDHSQCEETQLDASNLEELEEINTSRIGVLPVHII